MPSCVRNVSALCLLALFCSFAAVRPARAQFNIGPSKGQVIGAAVGAGAGLAVLGVGIYFLGRTPRVTGCLATADRGLELQGATPDELFLLTGNTSGLAAGERVKVLGKKSKDATGHRVFAVKSLQKTYGPCTATPVKTASNASPKTAS